MAYKDRFGITDITKGKRDQISISWDTDTNPENEKERYIVLLFIPDADKFEHHHVPLSNKQAKVLHKWLGDFLEGKPTRWKK